MADCQRLVTLYYTLYAEGRDAVNAVLRANMFYEVISVNF
jgi:hypothetical protein